MFRDVLQKKKQSFLDSENMHVIFSLIGRFSNGVNP